MSLTLGMTGMDPATETALRAAFDDANARLGDRWTLRPDAEADHVVVDMDSMYGPMSWLRLHAAGRRVVGLTSAPRTQTDYRLGRPFDTEQLVELLVAIARDGGVPLQPATIGAEVAASSVATQGAEAPDTIAAPADDAMAEPASPPVEAAPAVNPAEAAQASGAPSTSSPASQPEPPTAPDPVAGADADVVAAADFEIPAGFVDLVGSGADADARARSDSDTRTNAGTDAGADPVADVPAPDLPVERTLAAWLRPRALRGRHRFACGAGPTLLIDADAELWHGPTTLKPLAPCFEGIVDEAGFEPLDADAWTREAAAAGPAQPLSRLRWLGGLLAGGGALLPGLDPDGRFQLVKWPQTEREFPRHFRIATQMMKGPATVAEIAEASGMPADDVADFVNANLATGFAEPVVEAPPPAEPVKPRGGLLGRLRR